MSNIIPFNFGTQTIRRGTKRILEFLIKDQDGNPKDLTTFDPMVLRGRLGQYDAEYYLSKDVTILAQTGPNVGVCQVTFTRAETLAYNTQSVYATLFRNVTSDEDELAYGVLQFTNTAFDAGSRP